TVQDATDPEIVNVWSMRPAFARQVASRPQVAQAVPKPPPGFCHAQPLLDWTVRVVQNHWPPPPPKFMFTCTMTHRVPGVSTQAGATLIEKVPTGPSTKVAAGMSHTGAPPG